MKTIPAFASAAGAVEVAVVDEDFFVVVVAAAGEELEVGAVVAVGALVSAGAAAIVVVDFFLAIVVVADLVFEDDFAEALVVLSLFDAGAATAAVAADPFFVMADLMVVVGAAVANVALTKRPAKDTTIASGIRFDREGIILTHYRICSTGPRINAYTPGQITLVESAKKTRLAYRRPLVQYWA